MAQFKIELHGDSTGKINYDLSLECNYSRERRTPEFDYDESENKLAAKLAIEIIKYMTNQLDFDQNGISLGSEVVATED